MRTVEQTELGRLGSVERMKGLPIILAVVVPLLVVVKQTSPVKLTTSPTKPSQLSLLTFDRWPLTSARWPRSSLLATA